MAGGNRVESRVNEALVLAQVAAALTACCASPHSWRPNHPQPRHCGNWPRHCGLRPAFGEGQPDRHLLFKSGSRPWAGTLVYPSCPLAMIGPYATYSPLAKFKGHPVVKWPWQKSLSDDQRQHSKEANWDWKCQQPKIEQAEGCPLLVVVEWCAVSWKGRKSQSYLARLIKSFSCQGFFLTNFPRTRWEDCTPTFRMQ